MVNKLYWNSDDYVVELWGASTKHPDCVFHFKDYEKSTWFDNDSYHIFQWLLEIASKMIFYTTAKEIADFALSMYGKPIEEFYYVEF